jgi:cytochrome c oxidase cbb3-type subunit 2
MRARTGVTSRICRAIHRNARQHAAAAAPFGPIIVLAPLLVFCHVSSAAEGSVGPQGYDAARGRTLYIANCSACHGAGGRGQPSAFPPIKGSRVVTKDDATKHIQVVLDGLQGAKAGGVLYAAAMPSFAGSLDDVDIADIIDYERSSWGNHGKPVTAAEVAVQRARSK